MSRSDDVVRIAEALAAAAAVMRRYTPGNVAVEMKAGGDPVTELDRVVDVLLRGVLVRPGEGWLSEESADDLARLECRRVWVVDPLDGTREFVDGIPEYCVSIGLVEEGRAVAGGIHNPATGETILGALGLGVTRDGSPVRTTERGELVGARVLASRSETRRGEWERMEGNGFQVIPMGSVAYKLALVAAGHADATWTLVPKHEWDVAAGIALVEAAGGAAWLRTGLPPRLNRPKPLLEGLIAAGGRLIGPALSLINSTR